MRGRRESIASTAAWVAILGSLGSSVVAAPVPTVWPGPRAESPASVARRIRRLSLRKPAVSPQVAPEPPDNISADEFNECKKLAPGKQVPVTLKPDTDVIHLIHWISSITCRSFVWSSAQAPSNRRVTIVAPATVTADQAFRLFLDAMNSIGLTVQPATGFFQIIETAQARSRPIPVYDWDGHQVAKPRP